MRTLPILAVVTQPTRLKGLQARWATKGAARFRLAAAHAHWKERPAAAAPARGRKTTLQPSESALAAAAFEEYEQEDVVYQKTLRVLRQQLDLGYPIKFLDRDFLPNFDFGRCLAVVVVGRDGLVANAAKYVGDLPVIAVNPDPKRIDGILLPFEVRQARQAVQKALADKASLRDVTLAEANLNDGQRLLAFNDFFVGCGSHVSARYTLQVGGRSEPQSSSGLIVSTGAGSTGWLSSVFNMAEGVAQWIGGQLQPRIQLAWEDRRLVWAVREPFKSKYSGAELVAGLLEPGDQLLVESLMPSGGVIFSDGVEADFLEFNSGTIATIAASDQRARLVVG